MKCKLRKWRTSDAEALCRMLSDKGVFEHLRDTIPYPYTIRDAEEYLAHIRNANQNDVFAFAITVDDRVVGNIGVFREQDVFRLSGEIGYYLSVDHRGRGIMTDAVKQICEYVFENSNIIRIYATVFDDNIASCRVLEKAGFRFEGTLRRAIIKNEKIHDARVYALTKE